MQLRARRAEREVGRSCRIQADLGGPKLRTGPLEAAGRLLKIRPKRDYLARVQSPALVWLTPSDAPEATAVLAEGGEISETALDPVAGAAAAIDAAEPTPPPAAAAPAAAPAKAPAPARPKPKASPLDKPYIQIGIFNVEANAKRTADQMRSAGMIPTVYEQSANGKPFWRVVVGPSQTKSDRSVLLKQVKAAGFSDAYFVTN